MEAEWRIITPIEEAWAMLPAPAFPNYAAGTDGPADADALSGGDHRRWRRLVETPGSDPHGVSGLAQLANPK